MDAAKHRAFGAFVPFLCIVLLQTLFLVPVGAPWQAYQYIAFAWNVVFTVVFLIMTFYLYLIESNNDADGKALWVIEDRGEIAIIIFVLTYVGLAGCWIADAAMGGMQNNDLYIVWYGLILTFGLCIGFINLALMHVFLKYTSTKDRFFFTFISGWNLNYYVWGFVNNEWGWFLSWWAPLFIGFFLVVPFNVVRLPDETVHLVYTFRLKESIIMAHLANGLVAIGFQATQISPGYGAKMTAFLLEILYFVWWIISVFSVAASFAHQTSSKRERRISRWVRKQRETIERVRMRIGDEAAASWTRSWFESPAPAALCWFLTVLCNWLVDGVRYPIVPYVISVIAVILTAFSIWGSNLYDDGTWAQRFTVSVTGFLASMGATLGWSQLFNYFLATLIVTLILTVYSFFNPDALKRWNSSTVVFAVIQAINYTLLIVEYVDGKNLPSTTPVVILASLLWGFATSWSALDALVTLTMVEIKKQN